MNSFTRDARLKGCNVLNLDFAKEGTPARLSKVWLATTTGLRCYDGFQWRNYGVADGLPSDFVRSVLVTRAGEVWVGTDHGAGIFDGTNFHSLGSETHLAGSSVRRIIEDPDRTIWFCSDPWPNASRAGGLTSLSNGCWQTFGVKDGLPSEYVVNYFRDSSNRQWVATKEGVALWRDGKWAPSLTPAPGHPAFSSGIFAEIPGRLFFSAGLELFVYDNANQQWMQQGAELNHQHGITATADGKLIASTVTGVGRKVLAERTPTRWVTISDGFDLLPNYSEDVREDPDGNIWVVGLETATCWRRHAQWHEYRGTPPPKLIDGSGAIWFARDRVGSLTPWTPLRFDLKESRWDRCEPACDRLYTDSNGTVWGWSSNEVVCWNGGTPTQFAASDIGFAAIRAGRPTGQGQFCLAGLDGDGRPKLATFSGGRWNSQSLSTIEGGLQDWGLATFRGGAWLVVHPPNTNSIAVRVWGENVLRVGIPQEYLSRFAPGLHTSDDGSTVWLYGQAGLYKWSMPSGPWTVITNLPGRSVVGIVERGRELWVACNGATGGTDGAARWRDGRWESFTFGPIFGISVGGDQSVLLGSKGRFAWIENQPDATPLEVMLPENIRVDSVVRDREGISWAGNAAAVFRFVPDRLPPKTLVLDQDTNVFSGGGLTVNAAAIEKFRPAGSRADYAYSWRLDHGPWSPFRPEASRRLTPAELSEGLHVLSVRARDAGGEIDPTPATFQFRVHPIPLQNRPWFLGCVAGATILLAFLALVAARARAELTIYARTLEAKVAERTAALEADLVNRRRAEDALRESEERWHFALEGAGDGLWDWNAETNRVHFSSHWKSMLGYSDHEIGDHLDEWSDRIHPEDAPRVQSALQAHLEGRTASYAAEHRLRCRDGSYKWILDRGKVMSRTADGRPLRVIGTHTDISERKRVEQALQASEQRLNLTLDTLLEGCQIIGFDWRYLYVNRVAAEQSRRPKEELLGAKLTDVFPGLEQMPLYAALRRGLEERIAEKLENVFTYPDGTSAIFELEIRPVAVGIFIHSIDVTARRQAEQARENLVQLIEHSTDFIAMADLNGRLTYLNPAGRRMIGFGETEKIENLTLMQYVPDHWREFMRDTLLPTVREKGLWEGEMQLRHLRTGAIVEVSRSTFLVRDRETGEPSGFATVTRDITARKAAERAFRESEERFSKVFHANSAIIAISTYPEGQYVDVNEAFTDLLGYTRQEVLGRRALDLGIWPVPEQRMRIIAALERGAHVRGVECTIRAKNGRLLTFLASVERIELGGWPCILFINHDITARKESEASVAEAEERFRQLAENIREVFWLTDTDRKQMLYVSPAYERIWGRTCESLYQSPGSWVEAIHPDDRQRVADSISGHRSTGTHNIEYRIVRPDGSVRSIHDRAFAVRDAAGAVYRVAGLAEDITERRQLEAQFRQVQKMEALGTLSGGIAHDFNNILGAIFGNVHLAGLDLQPGQSAAKNLAEIEKAANRAKTLVRQILAFSRQQPPARQNMALPPVIHEAAGLLRATLPAGVELVKTIDPDCPNVFADASQIHQILLNLCTNSWHALNGERGRIEIQLRAETMNEDETAHTPPLHRGRYVRLSVLDTGHGMDAATLERIFEPFFTTKEPGHGTGLGLSVVHGIVQSHDGIIRVASQPGKGTEFHLYFPAIKAEIDVISPAGRSLRPGTGQRILYVDDEAALVDLAVRMLRRLAYEADGYTRPAAALDALREEPSRYQLVITDLHMPGLSGIEFIQNVRKTRPDIPVVLSSGFLTDEAAARARALGVARLLHKPNTLEDLSESIHELLGPKRP